MDVLSVDDSCLFPTQLLAVGILTDADLERELCWAYNRWLTERILPVRLAAAARNRELK